MRYYLGAQLDITGLVNDCTELDSLRKVIEQEEKRSNKGSNSESAYEVTDHDEFKEMSEAFSPQELERIVMLRRRQQAVSEVVHPRGRPRREEVILETPTAELDEFQPYGQGIAPALGFYQNYLLVRPHPSLRILFASPDLRIPGILQQPLMKSIGGSLRVRQDLAHALEVGRKVTAKVQWLSKSVSNSNTSWIHCTPLLGVNDSIGVWMVILVDADADDDNRTDPEVLEPQARTAGRTGGNYTTDALPWDTSRKDDHTSGVSTTIWSEGERKLVDEEVIQSKPRRAEYGPPPESVFPLPASKGRAGPSPTVGGNAYPYNPMGDSNATMDEISTIGAKDGRTASVDNRPSSRDERPSSQGSSIIPIRTQLRPTVKIAGRPSFDGGSAKPAPIQMPGQREVVSDDDPDGLRPIRKRTYKSLSPYGIIFNDR